MPGAHCLPPSLPAVSVSLMGSQGPAPCSLGPTHLLLKPLPNDCCCLPLPARARHRLREDQEWCPAGSQGTMTGSPTEYLISNLVRVSLSPSPMQPPARAGAVGHGAGRCLAQPPHHQPGQSTLVQWPAGGGTQQPGFPRHRWALHFP